MIDIKSIILKDDTSHVKTTINPLKSSLLAELINDQALSGDVMIVKMSIIETILTCLSTEQITMLEAKLTSKVPQQNGKELKSWLKAQRKTIGSSQRTLAKQLRDIGLKISGSDIGNLETGNRADHYGDEKIKLIAEKIIELKTIMKKNSQSN